MAKQKSKKFGLIGKSLVHSISQSVHKELHNHEYELIEIKPDKIKQFFDIRDFDAVNITIPYKSSVIKFLDNIDDIAKEIGAVNTVLNQNSVLTGYNTDYAGLNFLINHYNIDIKGKNILILGNGGSAKTAITLCKKLMAKDIKVAARTVTDNTCSFNDALLLTKTEVIINTTPVGMYPNINDKPLSLSNFNSLTSVIDIIYNPLRTQLLYEAKKKNVKHIGGLLMLIAQAKFASDIFLNTTSDNSIILDIYAKIIAKQQNIVLIGMPGSGKSHIGFLTSKKLNMEHIDIDNMIEKQENLSVTQIFDRFGESFFREKEKELIKKVAIKKNVVISTGGGSVLNEDSMKQLSQNGLIIFIDRDIHKLSKKKRPLSSNMSSIHKIYNSRINLYKNYSDIIIKNNNDIASCVTEIVMNIKKKGL